MQTFPTGSPDSVEWAIELKQAAIEIVEELRQTKYEFKGGPKIWDGVEVVRVSGGLQAVGTAATHHFTVTIQGVSPIAGEFKNAVQSLLVKRGFTGTTVALTRMNIA